MNTLIVNLFGAPGAGKSTTRAGVFNLLKLQRYNVEEVYEVAKYLTWQGRYAELACQPYVFGKQLRDTERLIGKVSAIITDSPIALSALYNGMHKEVKYSELFENFVIDHFKKMNNCNFFINRVKSYNPNGRNQTEEDSNVIAYIMKNFLERNEIEYIEVDGDENAALKISNIVREMI